MLPYWLLFALFAAGAVLYSGRPQARQEPSLLFVLACVATALMIGLRFEVGGDYHAYQEFYERMTRYAFSSALGLGDPGYSLVNWLVRKPDLGMWLVNSICAAIFVGGLGTFARRQPNPWLAMLIAVPYLIIVVAMGYTRQAVALGLVMWALAAFDRGAVRTFAISVLGAVTFHLSAIVVLPIGILSVTRNRLVTTFMLLVLTAMLYYIFVQSSVDRLFTNYVAAQYSSQGALIRVAMNLPPALIFLAARKRFAMSPDSTKLWTNMSIAALLCLVALAFSAASTAIDRLALYIIPLQIMVLSRVPMLFSRTKRDSIGLTALIIIYSATILYVWLNYAHHASSWVPYDNYLWQD